MTRTPWYRRLVTQTLASQLAVIAIVLTIASFAFARTGRSALQEQYGLRAQAIAESVAEDPTIRASVVSSVISPDVQEIAEAVRTRTGVSFVVVTDVKGVRHSHPNPERIGQRVSTDPSRALAGFSDWYVETGTLGPSVRGKVPIWDDTGESVVGIVSVGILTGEVSQAVDRRLGGLLGIAALTFAVGGVAAYCVARGIRHQTLGLEPPEIAAMYEHRDAMLRALHEGVIAVESDGRITLVNDAAATMLGLGSHGMTQRLDQRPDLAALATLADRGSPQVNVPLQFGTQTLLVTSSPFRIRGRHRGAVFTLRDRTELEGLVSELESTQGLVEALRAQAHEHSNFLHTISGLIELGKIDQVVDIIHDHATNQRAVADLYSRSADADSLLVALLLTKTAIATERDIRLRTHLGSLPHTEVSVSRDLVTIVGNLVDNAIDHLVAERIRGGEIEVALWEEHGAIRIEVSDSGRGIPPDLVAEVFQAGFTTKNPQGHDGLGLAIVHEIVGNYEGCINIDSEPESGSLFSVTVPLSSREVDVVV